MWTYEWGFGVGGAVVNQYALGETVYSTLFNRSFSVEEPSHDIGSLLRQVLAQQAEGAQKLSAAALDTVRAELARIDKWEAEFVAADGSTTSRYARSPEEAESGADRKRVTLAALALAALATVGSAAAYFLLRSRKPASTSSSSSTSARPVVSTPRK